MGVDAKGLEPLLTTPDEIGRASGVVNLINHS